MAIYEIDKLMAETRRLAAEFYKTTEQTLPVSAELARYDAVRLLKLSELSDSIKGVDALDGECKVQVKGRVIFNQTRSNYRIGQINLDGEWDRIVLVLFNAEYEATEIYACSRNVIEKALHAPDREESASTNKRGVMSVAKFKAISNLAWSTNETISN